MRCFLSAFVHVKLQEERRGTNEKERAEGKYTDGGVSGRRKAAVPASGDINLDFPFPHLNGLLLLLPLSLRSSASSLLVRSQALCAIERPHKA